MVLIQIFLGFILGCGIFLGVVFIKEAAHSKTLDGKFEKYPTDKVNTSKMIVDKYTNNLSERQIKKNIINGKYDK